MVVLLDLPEMAVWLTMATMATTRLDLSPWLNTRPKKAVMATVTLAGSPPSRDDKKKAKKTQKMSSAYSSAFKEFGQVDQRA